MRSVIFALTLMSVPAASYANNQRTLEDELWTHASTAGSIETLHLFVETFPNGKYVEDARALVKAMEGAQQDRKLEKTLASMVGEIKYDQPFDFGSERMIGSSISQLVQSSPTFPPVPGLQESYWKEQTCSNCHRWTREDLCTQATIYTKKDPEAYQSKQHPFGGLFKVGLSLWADGGCQ